MIEIILPSSKFATIRNVTWRDMDALADAIGKDSGINGLTFLVVAVTLLDDEPFTFEDFMSMDIRDARALSVEVMKIYKGPVLPREGDAPVYKRVR